MDMNCKIDLVVNNISEVFNRCILELRSKPIKTMTDGIRSKLTVKYQGTKNKIEEARWEITPTYEERLEKSKKYSRFCKVAQSGSPLWQVSSGDKVYAVKLEAWTCGCRRWDMTGVPCAHAVTAIIKAKLHPEDFVLDFFKKPLYREAYKHIIYLVPGPDLWPKTNPWDINPCVFKSKKGVQQTVRRKGKDEFVVAKFPQGWQP
ncbi:uncharacterized protein [Aegilops tauschii subsp. strangulata]|uniref:uncharacterized protein n=1 Tax=Aegilops tauschii subsp. strangulata TaxID=200361 RepID=UPI003CC8D55D